MTIPFDQLGPGQVGRAVFQVIGSDGPVYNPSRIRYLPISEAPTASAAAPALTASTALAGLNLIASIGTLAVSAQVLQQVGSLHKKLDDAIAKVDVIDRKLDALLSRVARIDSRVAENNLRHALDHVARRSITNTEIDLKQLARLQSDLLSMFESVDGWCVGGAVGLHLATDTYDRLEAIWHLLAGARRLLMADYNMRVHGDPEKVSSFNPSSDYVEHIAAPDTVMAYSAIFAALRSGREALNEDINSHFSFADSDDLEHYHSLFNAVVFDPVLAAAAEIDQAALEVASAVEAELHAAEQRADKQAVVDAFRQAWVRHTHAGLLWRTYVECVFAGMGYLPEGVDPASLGAPTTLTFECRVDAEAVALLVAGVPARASQ